MSPKALILLPVCLLLAGCSSEVEYQGSSTARTKHGAETSAPQRISPERLVLTDKDGSLALRRHLIPPEARSVLLTRRKLAAGEFVWNDSGVPRGSLLVWIDLQRQLASVYRAGHEIGTAVIVYGADDHPTPLGQFSIIKKARDYHSRSYDAEMPYALFITDDGVALHASAGGGGRVTHGCVGLPESFADLLFADAAVGDTVSIVRSVG